MSYKAADLPEQIRFMRTRRAKLVKQKFGHANDLERQVEIARKLGIIDDVLDSLIQLKRIKNSRVRDRLDMLESERSSERCGPMSHRGIAD